MSWVLFSTNATHKIFSVKVNGPFVQTFCIEIESYTDAI